MRAVTLSSLVAVAVVLGCSAAKNTNDSTGGGGSASVSSGSAGLGGAGTTTASGTGGELGLGGGFLSGSGGGNNTGGCDAASQLVYVFSDENQIYSFDPPTKKFTPIAQPDCAAVGSPNSMAIDRNLVAWLNYIGGIYTFDLKTKSGCQLAVSLPSGFQQIGMGFATDSPGSTKETLYVDGIGGTGLGRIDMGSKQLVKIGTFSNDGTLSGQSAELTGTGDARLFGYFTTFPYVRVAEIDKSSAAVLSNHELTGVTPPSSWAFTFWGGDFYLYAAPGTNATGNSSVIHYNPTTQAVDATYVADVGFSIIGAGVSTCAPLKPPT
ncbi:Hypothetical protein A7982_11191 [Minicystis rosea]|nr:Hypothetical protein A7982_11191 [Minicystis rosea]